MMTWRKCGTCRNLPSITKRLMLVTETDSSAAAGSMV